MRALFSSPFQQPRAGIPRGVVVQVLMNTVYLHELARSREHRFPALLPSPAH